MQVDVLYTIFEKHLFDSSDPEQNHHELVTEIVGEYIFHLMCNGNVPHQFLDSVEEDLREEVIDIYRKKTYGYFTLKDFRLAKLPSFS